jgi:very-short-patch-repair endonuclease
VRSRLAEYGITVVPQYGVGGYRVDFAFAHPDDPSRMILAVEADGASYRNSGSVRDRDRLRKEHLERLGWRFHRLWSTNWFHDADGEVAKLREAYEQAVAASPPIEADDPDPVDDPDLNAPAGLYESGSPHAPAGPVSPGGPLAAAEPLRPGDPLPPVESGPVRPTGLMGTETRRSVTSEPRREAVRDARTALPVGSAAPAPAIDDDRALEIEPPSGPRALPAP